MDDARAALSESGASGRVHPVGGASTRIGRDAGNDLVLSDPLVSRLHCRIDRDGDAWTLTDLGSRFGTFLNDQRVEATVPLKFGDLLRIGGTELRFDRPTATPARDDAAGGLDTRIAECRALAQRLAGATTTSVVTPELLRLLEALQELEADVADVVRRQILMRTLTEVGGLIGHIPDLETVLRLTLDRALGALGADRGFILLRQGESLRVRIARGIGVDDSASISLTIAQGVAEDAVPVLTTDAQHDPRFQSAASVVANAIRAVMCVPLRNKRLESIGAIYVDSRPGNPMFDAGGLEFLSGFAGQATIAIENAQLAEHTAREIEQRRRLSRYFSEAVIDDILSEGGSPEKLGGQSRTVTLLFTDIRNFTGIMERLEPTEAFDLLNEYFTEIVDELLQEQGTLDKFTGDGLMAFWNAPRVQEDHALRAVRTALRMQERIRTLAASWRRLGQSRAGGAVELATGIGIHTGEAMVGNVGSPKRMEYTAIGDTVNVTARLQGVAAGGEVLISLPTMERVAGKVVAEPLPPIPLKGKTMAVQAFRVLRLR